MRLPLTLTTTAVALAVVATPAVAATPDCNDAVASTLHRAHEAHPALRPAHAAEEAYCDARP